MSNQKEPALVARIRRYFPQVDRVADATKPMKFEVTEKDCTGAKSKAEDDCAVARSCERIPGIDGAIIRTSLAYIIKGNLAIKYVVPASVSREIVSFDRHHDFRPGEYQLSAVYASRTQAKKAKGGGAVKSKGSKHVNHRRPLISKRTEGVRGAVGRD